MSRRKYLREFNAGEFRSLHEEMKTTLEGVGGKEVIAFVGLTGAGKSTSLNFLLGDEMEKVTGGLSTRYQVKKPNACKSAQIGHDGSETLFPAAYEVEGDSKTVLLDTAGLGDTRGKNVSLCISLALTHISEVAKIKGIVIVLRQSAITDP